VIVAALLLGAVGCGRQSATPVPPETDEPAVTTDRPDEATGADGSSIGTPRTPAETVRVMAEGLRQNRPQAVWYCMPPGFREDVEGLVHEFAAKVDPPLWQRSFAVWRRVADVLDRQRPLVIAHPDFADLAPEQRQRIDETLGRLAALLRTLSESDLADLERLRRLSVGEFLEETGGDVLRQLGALSESLGEGSLAALMSDLEPRILEEKADVARVGWFVPGEEKPASEFHLIRAGRRWVPSGWVDAWDAVRAAREKLRSQSAADLLGDTDQRRQALDRAELVLDDLSAANTPQQLASAVNAGFGSPAWDQTAAVLRTFAGAAAPAAVVEAEPVATEPTEPTPQGPTNAAHFAKTTEADYVTVEFRGPINKATEEVIYLALQAAVPGDSDLLPAAAENPDALAIQAGPVADVTAFSQRLRIGRVVNVDAERRRIIVELPPMP
jgi:hypothetical protein